MAEHAIWHMCKYTPVEIFAGFDVDCVRLEPDTDSFDAAESLGHANMCGYGKGILEAAMRRGIKELVLVNCCDVVRRVYDILEAKGGMDFLYLIDLPHRSGDDEDALMESQIRRMIRAYETYSGLVFSEQAFLRAWTGKNGCGACVPGRDPEEKDVPGRRLLSPEEVEAEQGTCISLQGAHSGAFLPAMLRGHLPLPVRDDTCTGNRHLAAPPDVRDPSDGWLRSYAHALLSQMPCMRMTDVSVRAALGKDAAGIVYHTMKFCDYYGFEYAGKMSGRTPLLKIETDGTRQSEGQLATRIDAFAESLRAQGLLSGKGGREKQRSAQAEIAEGTQRETEEVSRMNGATEEKDPGRTPVYTAGVDSGSASTDAVILDGEGKLVGWSIVRTGSGAASGAQKALDEALEMAGIRREDLREVVSTGYGRETIGLGEDSVTEITCHARGAHALDPAVRTVIDIGGQDSKVIRVDAHGAVVNFAMNDKCAAGTGRFLEMMARTLEMSMEEMSRAGLSWKKDVQISSMCTVFAESEVVSLIAQNTAPEDIIHGLNESVATRTAALLRRVGGEGPYMMTGGVAQNEGLVRVLEKKLGEKIIVSPHAQIVGAIGAALTPARNVR